MYPFIYLASQSPRRQEILQQMGVRFELLLPGADEDAESLELQLNGEAPLDYVQRVTLAKLEAATQRLQNRGLSASPILCADTTVAVALDDHQVILGKPEDDQDGARILSLLSGKTHQVHTAVAIQINNDSEPLMLISTSDVAFKTFSSDEIALYLASGEHRGKAGAYGIQGLAACFVENIRGSFSGIMGLPVFETTQLLQQSDVQFALSR
ncbi:MAG: septum formation protein Maf [Pseudomonadota bacterium]|jgi:septum formation protein